MARVQTEECVFLVLLYVCVCVCLFDQLTGPFEQRDKSRGCVLKPWRHGRTPGCRGTDGQGGRVQKHESQRCVLQVFRESELSDVLTPAKMNMK